MIRIVGAAPVVAPVPVILMGLVHVEADEQDAPCTPLNCQVERLETAIAAGASLAVFREQLVGVLVDFDPVNVREALQAVLDIADLVPSKFWKALPELPPGPIAAIDNVSERNEVNALLDGYDAAVTFQKR